MDAGWSRMVLELPDADPVAAEVCSAQAFDAGAAGVEERETPGGAMALVVYAETARVATVARALADAAPPGAVLGAMQALDPVDWSRAWRRGLGPVEVSPRLVVRPPFAEARLRPGQAEVLIDPGRAFGTGTHASTRLALAWIDALCAAGRPGAALLDAGTGSGVLALAALRLGVSRAVGFDLDPLAAPEARRNARANGLDARLDLFTGPAAAVAGARFERVVANLLRTEMLPIARELAGAVAPGGALLLSGLLESERAAVETAFAAHGLQARGARATEEGGERWVGLMLTRDGPAV